MTKTVKIEESMDGLHEIYEGCIGVPHDLVKGSRQVIKGGGGVVKYLCQHAQILQYSTLQALESLTLESMEGDDAKKGVNSDMFTKMYG